MHCAAGSSAATLRSPLLRPRCGPSRESSRRRGPPTSCGFSCVRPLVTGCSPPCGSRPTPGSVEVNCSACAGATSMSTTPVSRSTADSWPSATRSTNPAARPTTPAAASTSTRPPSRSSTGGGPCSQRSSPRWASTHLGGHHRVRRPRAPALDQPDLRPHRPTSSGPDHPIPRASPHARQPSHRLRRRRHGRQGTPRSRRLRVHRPDVPAHLPAHARQRRRCLRNLLTPGGLENPALPKAG